MGGQSVDRGGWWRGPRQRLQGHRGWCECHRCWVCSLQGPILRRCYRGDQGQYTATCGSLIKICDPSPQAQFGLGCIVGMGLHVCLSLSFQVQVWVTPGRLNYPPVHVNHNFKMLPHSVWVTARSLSNIRERHVMLHIVDSLIMDTYTC